MIGTGIQQHLPQGDMIPHAAADFKSGLTRHRQTADMRACQSDIKLPASHKGQIAYSAIGQLFNNSLRLRTGKRKACNLFTQITNCDPVIQMIVEPAHMPAAQIIGPHDPPAAIAPVEQRQITFQPAITAKCHRQTRTPFCRHFGGKNLGKPCFGIRARNLEAREAGNIQQTDTIAYRTTFITNNVESV